jgi:hypothetical protein
VGTRAQWRGTPPAFLAQAPYDARVARFRHVPLPAGTTAPWLCRSSRGGLAARGDRAENGAMRSSSWLRPLVPVLASLAGCWSPRHFAPREHVAAVAPDGSAAASYTVPDPAGALPAAGELRIWSRGASARYADGDREVVELHVGFELENNSAEPLQLDLSTVVLEGLVVDGAVQPPPEPLRIDGDGTARAAATARVDLTWELPAHKPRAVDGFAVRFAVRAGNAVVLQQLTPFGVVVRDPDPYWGPAWSVGFGVGWHAHHWHHH